MFVNQRKGENRSKNGQVLKEICINIRTKCLLCGAASSASIFLLFWSLEVCFTCKGDLRRLSESLILIVSVMFGATFNLVTRVGLP